MVVSPSTHQERLRRARSFSLFRRLLIALLVELPSLLPLLGGQALHPLVVTALFYARRHARHKMLRLWQEFAIENFGDFIEAVPLHVVRAVHGGPHAGAASLVVPQLVVSPFDGCVEGCVGDLS